METNSLIKSVAIDIILINMSGIVWSQIMSKKQIFIFANFGKYKITFGSREIASSLFILSSALILNKYV